MKATTKFWFTNIFSVLGLFGIFATILLGLSIPVEAAQSNYTTSNNQILRDGKVIQLRGINWFGAETSDKVFHGLWARNYKSMITQMKSVGFNAVRVPFCPATLKNQNVSSVDYSINSDLRGLKSLEIFDKIINEINNQGMYFLLDHHRPDCNAISELWYTGSYSESDWINDLKFVAKRYNNLSNYVGIDLKNEPHGAATWGKNNPKTDWNLAAERAGKAVLSVNPKLLIFVEGIASNGACETVGGHWWGGNLEPLKCKDISTSSIPANKLVLSPHVYGTDVSNQPYFSSGDFPNNMSKVWDTHFGFALAKGKTLAPGEFGGKYGLEGGSAKDKIVITKLIDYFAQKKICNTFYWSWNANSGDTGGILKDDWQNVWTEKVNLLKKLYSSCGNAGSYNPPTIPSPSPAPKPPVNTSKSNPSPKPKPPVNIPSQPAKSCNVEYKVVSYWNKGWQGAVKINNTSQNAVNNWNLTMDMPSTQTVYQSWDSKYLGKNGNSTKFVGDAWNKNINAKSSTELGFLADKTAQGAPVKPTNFKLNGTSCTA